ncbi:conserved hypothetical protein [Bosea sp. 62]|uniref:DUF930 domain-containing protein n=1 Tax=unclassified Bosea (in: a-proteobacteria) TaxID=2653178 RepID=UPI00125247C7|nr:MULTISPECIES: DUF930 domain-containing protein [unclassified Bosea (in: a-proteobacteria)]CAD5291096.1 conserved hypothetical protein [Bosea sp. 7B]CAD5299848.1 conserved hypothetical protein [Bosea sp. 21B]CAD5300461.1 conserved hypothetical protein [Bosea sp. 46]VVT61777.1 conserved hypothetical protein [Bosea sp. EC-HK365B]VXB02967.1 conserved hypothetical protein [Bosea sp. 127]
MQRAGTAARVLREPGLPAALCFHLLFGLLLAIRTISSFTPPIETSVEVELVAPEALTPPAPVQAPAPPSTAEIASPPQPAPPTAPPEKPITLPAPPPTEPPAMITARTLHSESVLANPRSRGAREALKTLEAGERIEQLCNLEAMSQIHAWKAEFEPDRVVAYAMAGTKLTKSALEAEGAAFRSRKHWYGLRFRCEMAANGKVAGFQFRVGEAIPRSEWAAHDLPPEH